MTSTKEKISLITCDLQEIIDPNNLIEKITEKRQLKIYWGTAPTGKIHIGYLYPIMKLADFVKADCDVTILLADLHGMLDNMKSTPKQIEFRTKYYEEIIKSLLELFGVDLKKITFIKGSSFQLKPEYTMDMYKLGMLTSIATAQKASSEVVKQTDNPLITNILYPILQSLDEEYLKIDAFFGGIDQRKICVYAREFLPKIGYKQRIDLFNPIIPGLSATKTNGELQKMSSSDTGISKIDILDTPNEINKKVSKAYCVEKDIKDNTPLLLVKNLVFPLLNRFNKPFEIKKNEKYGNEIIKFTNYEELEKKYLEDLHPQDLKKGISDFFSNLLEPVRKKFANKDLVELLKKSYSNKS